MAEPAITLQFSIPVSAVPEEHRQEAERLAREAFVLSVLRQGDISAGRAAEVLGIDRWTLDKLMSDHGISPFGDNLTAEELAGGLANWT